MVAQFTGHYKGEGVAIFCNGDRVTLAQLLREGNIPHTCSIGKRSVRCCCKGIVNILPLAFLLVVDRLGINGCNNKTVIQPELFRVFRPVFNDLAYNNSI